MQYQVPQNIDPNKVFLVNFQEVQGRRLDPVYISSMKNKNKYKCATKSLNKLVSFISGGTPSKEEAEYWNGNIFWVSAKDFKSFYIDSSEDTITELGLKYSSSKLIPENTLLMVVRSGILRHTLPIAINKYPVAINQDIKALLIKDKNLSVQYLGHYFNIFNKYVLSKIVKHSTTVQSVNTNELESLEIPIPPVEIQQKIITIMDTAYAQKQHKEQQAESLLQNIDDYLLGVLGIILPETNTQILKDRFFTSNFSDIKGRLDPFYYQPQYKVIDEIIDKSLNKCTLGDVIISLNNGIEVRNYVESGYRYLRVTDMGKHELNDSSVKYIKITEIPNRIKLNENCILVSRSGSLGLISEVNKSMLDFVLSSHIFKVELNPQLIHPKYAVEILRSRICQNQIFRNNNGGIIPEIQQNALKSIKIPLPSLEKQHEIVDYIANIRNQAKTLQKEGKNLLEQAKREVEKMILSGEYYGK